MNIIRRKFKRFDIKLACAVDVELQSVNLKTELKSDLVYCNVIGRLFTDRAHKFIIVSVNTPKIIFYTEKSVFINIKILTNCFI